MAEFLEEASEHLQIQFEQYLFTADEAVSITKQQIASISAFVAWCRKENNEAKHEMRRDDRSYQSEREN